jgi:hypothetical protein
MCERPPTLFIVAQSFTQEESKMAATPRVRLNGNGHSNGHGKVNGNGHSNGHAPTIAVLQAEIATSHGKLKELTAEREGLALAAVQNDAVAVSRVAEIDAERQRLANRSETLQAAVRQLHAQQREAGWQKWLPHALRIYRGTVIEQREMQAFRLQRYMYAKAPGDLRDLAQQVALVEDFAVEEAHRLARQLVPDSFGRIFTDAGDGKARQAATAKTAQLRAHATSQLAEALVNEARGMPFPGELLAVLRAANERLMRAGVAVPNVRPSIYDPSFIGRAG